MERVNLAVELTPAQVRPIVYRVVSRKYGLNLKSTALQVFADHLGHKFGSEWKGPVAERHLDEIARLWRDQDRGLFVEGDELKTVIQNIDNLDASLETTAESQQQNKPRFHWKDYFKVVSLLKQRRFVYNQVQHRFELGPTQTSNMLGDAAALTRMIPSRYFILLDRIQRSNVFGSKERHLTPIKNMIGRASTHFFIFGLLSRLQGSKGAMWLVDNSSHIELEFCPESQVMSDHYYCEGSFAICEGQLVDEKFLVLSMGPPIPEQRTDSKDAFGNIDFLGLISQSRTQVERIDYNFEQILVQEEIRHVQHRIVILGCDLHLDKTPHLDALRFVLTKLEQNPPIGLVLVGNFCSQPFHQQNSIAKYTEVMAALALLLKEFPRVCHETKLSIMPGENDPWHSADSQGPATWPTNPLPDLFTRRVSHAAKDIAFTSNPTRISYLSQEIVICNEHYGEQFRQSSINLPHQEQELQPEEMEDVVEDIQSSMANLDLDIEDELVDRQIALNDLSTGKSLPPKDWTFNSQDERARKIVATILDQAHMAPFTVQQRPIVWESENALSMAQWPDVLVTIDPSSPRFAVGYHGCVAFNPGKFLRAGSVQWLEYFPHNHSGILMSEKC